MHCVSSYPTKLEDINLQNIAELKKDSKLSWFFQIIQLELKQQFRPFFFGAKVRKTFYTFKGSSKLLTIRFQLILNK